MTDHGDTENMKIAEHLKSRCSSRLRGELNRHFPDFPRPVSQDRPVGCF
jgi:hypothetical protein